MISYSSTVTIRRPPSEVYAALLDPDRYHLWTEMVDVALEPPGEPRVGSVGRFRLAKGPIKDTLTYRITALEPHRRIRMEIDAPALAWTSDSTLEPVEGGTRVEYAGRIGLRGWRRLLEPLVAGEVRSGEAKEIARLKTLLEGDAARDPAPA